MNCLRCNTPNEEGSKFCKNCGMDMEFIPSADATNSKLSDILLTIFFSIAFVSAIAQYTIQKVVTDWYTGPAKYVQSSFWILQNLTFILIPFAIRNKTAKIIGFFITSILVIYWVYQNVQYMLS